MGGRGVSNGGFESTSFTSLQFLLLLVLVRTMECTKQCTLYTVYIVCMLCVYSCTQCILYVYKCTQCKVYTVYCVYTVYTVCTQVLPRGSLANYLLTPPLFPQVRGRRGGMMEVGRWEPFCLVLVSVLLFFGLVLILVQIFNWYCHFYCYWYRIRKQCWTYTIEEMQIEVEFGQLFLVSANFKI